MAKTAATPAHPLEGIAAAQRERLAYIEFLLRFLGEVTRKDLLERFGVQTAAGTRDLALYMELAPGNAIYEGKRFRYQATFKPLFEVNVARVLSALTTGFGDGERAIAADLVAHAIPDRLNLPKADILAEVTRAIHGGYALRLQYSSMKTGQQPREIVPHALVDSGVRWHVRAYDRTKGMFRDLVLTRMDRLAPVRDKPVDSTELSESDQDWNRTVSVELIPHPRHKHPASVAQDYGMRANRLKLQYRDAYVGYAMRLLQVDCSAKGTLDPTVYRLRLKDPGVLEGVSSAELAPR